MSLVSAFSRRAPKGVLSMFGQRTAAVNATANSDIFKAASPMPASKAVASMGGVRHAGASLIAAGAATVALGGVAQGIGSVFAALVVGTARNPAIKDDLFGYTMIGFGMVELVMFIVIGLAAVLMTSD